MCETFKESLRNTRAPLGQSKKNLWETVISNRLIRNTREILIRDYNYFMAKSIVVVRNRNSNLDQSEAPDSNVICEYI